MEYIQKAAGVSLRGAFPSDVCAVESRLSARGDMVESVGVCASEGAMLDWALQNTNSLSLIFCDTVAGKVDDHLHGLVEAEMKRVADRFERTRRLASFDALCELVAIGCNVRKGLIGIGRTLCMMVGLNKLTLRRALVHMLDAITSMDVGRLELASDEDVDDAIARAHHNPLVHSVFNRTIPASFILFAGFIGARACLSRTDEMAVMWYDDLLVRDRLSGAVIGTRDCAIDQGVDVAIDTDMNKQRDVFVRKVPDNDYAFEREMESLVQLYVIRAIREKVFGRGIVRVRMERTALRFVVARGLAVARSFSDALGKFFVENLDTDALIAFLQP